MAEPEPEILPEAVAKRRLAIYTLIRLAGVAVLGGGVVMQATKGAGVVSVLLMLIGAASLFIRPRMLGKLFGTHW